MAFRQDPRTKSACCRSLHSEWRQPYPERDVTPAFLALLWANVPRHSRPFRSARSILGHYERNPAAKCGGTCYRVGKCFRKRRRVCGAILRWLVGAGFPQHRDSVCGAWSRDVGLRRIGVSVAQITPFGNKSRYSESARDGLVPLNEL